MKKFSQFLAGLVFAFWGITTLAQPIGILEKVANIAAPNYLANMGWVKRQEIVQLSAGAKDITQTPGKMSLRLDLFSDVQLDLIETKREVTSAGVFVANFDIVGDKGGTAVIANSGAVITATVSTSDHKVYRIMHIGNGLHRVEELDHSKFPDCATHTGSAKIDLSTVSNKQDPVVSNDQQADNGSEITVLVAYTQAVDAAVGGASAVSSLVATAISESNTGYTVSGIPTRLSLVHTVKVNYNESAGFNAALDAITGTTDGAMDEVHALRDTYKADLVVLLISNTQYCGMAWKPDTVSSSNSKQGFSVTAYTCATGYYSFAHEIGHNMGATHDLYVDTSTVPYAFGHGYVNKADRIRSIMAYGDECTASGINCTRVNHWSASDRLYNGLYVIGNSATARNNDALTASIAAIANYRIGAATATSYVLSVSLAGSGIGTVTSNPVGISCGSTCSASYAGGTSVTLTAAPGSGNSFSGWGGVCSGSSSTCTVTMNAANSVSASFAATATTRQVTVTKSGNGTITSSPSGISCGVSCSTSTGSFPTSSSVTFTATPDSGNTFGGWTGACTGTGSCTVAAGTASVSLGAAFATITGSTTTTLQNGVSVTGQSGSFGSSALFSIAVPSGASNLVINTSGGTGDADLFFRLGQVPTTSTYDCSSRGSTSTESCALSTPAAGTYYVLLYGYSAYSGVTVTASYATTVTTRLVTLTKSGNGSVISSPGGISCGVSCLTSTGSFSSSTSVTFTATPDSGNTFGGWTGACTGTGSCTVAAGTASVSLGAAFATITGSTTTTLQNGVSVTGRSGSLGSSALFSIAVPTGASNLVITTSGGTGDADLFVRLGQVPTTGAFDCSSISSGSAETCLFSAPTAGTYYVLLYGYSAYSGVTVRASYTTATGSTLLTRYRLYHDGTKEHLYTTDANEYSVLATRGWLAEGAIYQLYPGAGSLNGVVAVPFYRLYNRFSQQHHWTTDANEYNVLGQGDWTKEGVDGYILPSSAAGSIPVYRLYLNAFGGLHLWTTDLNEKNVLSTRGWVYEGVAGYVVPLQ